MRLHNSRLARRASQKGLATLLITVVILVAITLVIIFTSQTAVLEQRMSANELRMKQSSNASQAGVDAALHYASEHNRPPEPDEEGGISALSHESDEYAYRVVFLDPGADEVKSGFTGSRDAESLCGATPSAFPAIDATLILNRADSDANLRDTVVLSCGWSDDRAGLRASFVGVQSSPSMADPPDNPLTTRGGLAIDGTAAVFNAYTDTTIRSGGDLSISGGGQGNSYLWGEGQPRPSADPDDPDPVPDERSDYVQESRGDLLGRDVIDRDDNFGVGSDEFFRSFMGMSLEDYRSSMESQIIESDGDTMEFGEDEWGQTIWIDGDVRLEGTLGSRENPALLIVDGNLETRGNFDDFHGVLYVTGDLDAGGNPRFFGAAVIQGRTEVPDDAELGGTPEFYFDPLAASTAGRLGARTLVAGTWRDWTHAPD
ncbi:pilus assembly PilX N-terminal domain-containing protein [Thioalkalivibrio sp. AKL17]|uniref:pilus assembly PilX family protein n=1 Tax=Thioalkalivibrio sp. AKL17 TaxID=1158160 RepID=UPI0003773BBB|nr:pilus assembly PilX N-terminal domain-containing protein [Thioalkalivibrio sp. AKL17]